MALSKEVREACLARLADESTGLNPRFVQHCKDAGVFVPMPGTGAQSGMPFNFTAGKSVNVFQIRVPIDVLEQNSQLQYPCMLISATSAREAQSRKVTPSMFWGQITIDLWVYLSWTTQQGPPNNNFEIQLDCIQRSLYEVFNGGINVPGQPAGWDPGIIYNGDISEVTRTDLQLHNDKQNWRRGSNYTLTFLALE